MPYAVPPATTFRRPLISERVSVNWEHPLNRGLAFWFLMNEGTGPVINDAARKVQPAVLTGHLWGAADGQQALYFDNTSDYATISNACIGPATQWTFHAKMRINQTGGSGTRANVFSEMSSTTSGWAVRTYSTGVGNPSRFTCRIDALGADGVQAVIPHLVICDLTWVYDRTTIYYYLNGSFVESAAIAAGTPQTVECYLGKNNITVAGTVLAWYYSASLHVCALSAESVYMLYANHYGTPDNPRLI